MKVAAFNVKNLGDKKVSDDFVSSNLIKIISQYSIVVILEVVDEDGTAMHLLLQKLNNLTLKITYKMVCSPRLGRSTYKEQYVYFYRSDEVKLMNEYQYEDQQAGDEDVFAREPFIVHFHCFNTVVEDLVLIPVHTNPEDTERELDELYDVVMDVLDKWDVDNIMILGDFNAGGRYLSQRKKKSLRINAEPFHWLIDDKVDTTASNCNDNTYDRIVVYGSEMLDAIVPKSAKPFNFQREFGLTESKALRISDHYPVEVQLKPRTNRGAQRNAAAKRKRGQASAAGTSGKRGR
ncbi:deoxyribonuclease-1-like isoform X2 [Kryptolebias marmoratus]|uniref:deoxyribonuclease-1-like isoform X2 n=1 Tax=Kryptolebias marmoratus TaxID=37003 RepID=UPI0007F8663D|nr:deoxyribonuclease-1-like isoform X2 [Kryptolebias marmoratus]